MHELSHFPKDLLVGASCHSENDLKVAEEKNADFAVLGSSKKNPHPSWPWAYRLVRFNKLVNNSNIPIYSIGGMTDSDILSSLEYGGIGIASQR